MARGGGGAGTWFASSFRHPAQQLSMLAMERTYIMVRTYCTIVDTCVKRAMGQFRSLVVGQMYVTSL
jgi:hypothetical protein